MAPHEVQLVSNIWGDVRVVLPLEPPQIEQNQMPLIKWSDKESYALFTFIREHSGGKSKIAWSFGIERQFMLKNNQRLHIFAKVS